MTSMHIYLISTLVEYFVLTCMHTFSPKITDNDFQSPAYGKKYNDLQQVAFNDGRLSITGCPDKV